MKTRNQVLILEAIGKVRRELKVDMCTIEMAEVMTRLTSLYSLLDTDVLILSLAAEHRDEYKEAA